MPTLAAVTDEQLARPFPEAVGRVTLGTGQFLTHLAAHLAFHLGQADRKSTRLNSSHRT